MYNYRLYSATKSRILELGKIWVFSEIDSRHRGHLFLVFARARWTPSTKTTAEKLPRLSEP